MPIATDRLSKLQTLKLIQAVHEKNVQSIVKLIENGIPNLVNFAEPSQGHTGLHLAACSNYDDIIKNLISFGADCNNTDFEGRTPYMRAAEFGHVQALTALLEGTENVDLSACDLDGNNICHCCLHSTKRHQSCLQLAINYGANVHICNNDGISLLFKATEEGLDKAVKTILDAGVDVDTQHKKTGLSALHIASEKGLDQCARLLLKFNANPNKHDYHNFSVAHSAAKHGNLNILKILSAYGADFNVTDSKRNTPMHYAATNGYDAVCKYLGQRGCPATVKNLEGKLARIIAKENEHKVALKECKKAEKIKGTKPGTQIEIVKFYDWMMENKELLIVDVNDYDTEVGGSRSGKIKTQDFISVLRANKSPLNEDRLQGILKSHDSQQSGEIDYELFFTAKKFINKLYLLDGGGKKKKGGSGKKGKKKGKTKIEMPICVQEEKLRIKSGGPLLNYVEKKQLLTDLTRFDKDNPPLHPLQDDSAWYSYKPDATFIHINEVIKYNDRESAKTALKEGHDVDQLDKFYKTPLMVACLEGNFEMVQYFVSHGANVNATDNFKWTAMHFACHTGQRDIVEFLLNNGASLDVQSFNGGTPIMRAIESSKPETVQFLIDKGAKIQVENRKGSTALDIAYAFADPRIVEIVKKRWDQLPPPIDKRKKGSPKKRSAKTSNSSSTKVSMPNIKNSDATSKNKNNVNYEEHKATSAVISAASAIANGLHQDKAIQYTPKRAWLPEPTTVELMAQRQDNRERFGYEVDFVDYEPPYQSHVSNLVTKLDIE